MTREEVYEKIKIPSGYHFLYLGVECVIDERPSLVCREHIGDWRRPYYSKFQLSELFRNTKEIRKLSIKEWHNSPYDSFEIEQLIAGK